MYNCTLFLVVVLGSGNSVIGYVANISPIKTARKDSKRKYFDFDLITYGSKERTVCFSPEKHPLLQYIQKEKTGCELKKFKRSDNSDIMITDFTSVRKLEPDFPNVEFKPEFESISKVINENALYDTVSVK